MFMSGSIPSSLSVYVFLPMPFRSTVYQPGYILSAAITATPLLFTRQLTMTPGRSQRSTGSKGSGGWEAPGCKCLAATSGACNDCLSTWCLQRCQTLVSAGLVGRAGRWLNRECAGSDGDVEGWGGQWVHYHSEECTSSCWFFVAIVRDWSSVCRCPWVSAQPPHPTPSLRHDGFLTAELQDECPPPPTVLLKHSWSLMTLPST